MDDADLRAALHTSDQSNTDKLLIILHSANGKPLAVKDIRSRAIEHGIRSAKNWNISQLLGTSRGRAILVQGGWELSPTGKQYINALGLGGNHIAAQQSTTLRNLLPAIMSPKNRQFVAEAVACYETKNFRAAAVLAWVGAVSILYDHVIHSAISKFSNEWVNRNPQKNKPITNIEDLSNIKEDTFLDILQAISVIGKSVKDELKGCLKFRNGCGHPNTLVVGETRVAAHLETLINNVYQKF